MSDAASTRDTADSRPGDNRPGDSPSRRDDRYRADDDGGSRTGTGKPARTGVAAVFSLVLGLIAFLAAITGLLAPVAVVLGLIGLILGIVGIRAAKKPRTTGKGVAIGGLVLSVIALLLGVAAIIGVASVLSSNPQILDQISNLVNSARSRIPGA